MMNELVMVADQGFYLVDTVNFVPIEKQARDHGLLNAHIQRVEDLTGNILWNRSNENSLS
jgi:hypothetical protein